MGFSQGACMATRLGHLAEQGTLQAPSPRLVILIGGVPPKDLEAESSTSSGSAEAKLLATPSPHIHDTADRRELLHRQLAGAAHLGRLALEFIELVGVVQLLGVARQLAKQVPAGAN